MSILEKLASRSRPFTKPFLVHFYSGDNATNYYFINDNSDLTYGDKIYKAASFTYFPNPSNYGFDGGGTIEISPKEGEGNLPSMVISKSEIFCDIVGTINERGTITELKSFSHKYGIINGNREKITFNYSASDIPEMTFPSLIWSVHNNQGNA